MVIGSNDCQLFINERFLLPMMNQSVSIFNENKILRIPTSQRAIGIDGGQNFVCTAGPAVDVDGLNKIS